MLFPFQIPLEAVELTGFALVSLQIPHRAAAHVKAGPSSHPQPWEQHPLLPPAAREWAEMGCGQEQAAEPLLLGYGVKSSIVNGGGNLQILIDAPQMSGMSICYRSPVLLGRALISGPSRDHQKVIAQPWELETGNVEVWTCSENWRH